MGRTLAVLLADRYQVCSATECSGCFVSRTRYRDVNWAHNEGHASAVRTGHKRQLCTCTPWEGSEVFGAVPTTAFPLRETLEKAGPDPGRRPAGRVAIPRDISRPLHPAGMSEGERAAVWDRGNRGWGDAACCRRRPPSARRPTRPPVAKRSHR